jgi:hypothetical protein
VIFPLRGGLLAEPINLNFADLSEPKSVEAALRQALEPQLSPIAESAEAARSGNHAIESPAQAPEKTLRELYGLQAAPPELDEHLSLVARWFYSKPREGEILFREKDWPYRRVLRACARLLTPPSPEPEKSAPS